MKLLMFPALLVLGVLVLQLQQAAALTPWMLLLAAGVYLPALLFHECSHWLMAKRYGVNGQLGWWQARKFRPRFQAPPQPALALPEVRNAIFAAGPWSDALCVSLAGAVALYSGSPMLQALWVVPALLFASNLLPVGATDAAQILRNTPSLWPRRVLLILFFAIAALVLLIVSLGIARALWPSL